ncbi:hypothetical protein FRC06_005218, partial [Ceratobasidium sp. 370]
MTSNLGRLSIHIQPSCAEHRYIRDKDVSTIVERPERLRALAVGIAAAIALAEAQSARRAAVEPDDLIESLEHMKLESGSGWSASTSIVARIVRHSAPEDTVAGSGEEYLSQLALWVSDVESHIKAGESEIPDEAGLSEGDLYRKFQIYSTLKIPRAFVAIRPPGHHCGSDEPAGFCWVNNVLVAAAHAYHAHGVNRAVIFDIDLHRGNGTQSIAWKINADTRRKSLEAAAKRAANIPDCDDDQNGD